MKIYYTARYTDEQNKEWFSINGDTHYPLDKWTEEEARADYESPEHAMEYALWVMEDHYY